METERRRYPRKKPGTLAFIDLLPDNGGVVTDVGEGGLGFRTSAGMERKGPIQCWFSLEAFERLEAVGELVWLDPVKKAGGLKFVQLPEATRLRIREWLGEPPVKSSGAAEGELALRREPADAQEKPAARILAPLAVAPERTARASKRSASTIIPSAFSLTAPASEISAELEEEEPRSGVARGIFIVILVCAVLAGAGWFLYARMHRPAEGVTAQQEGQGAQPNAAAANAVPPTQPAPTIPSSSPAPTATPPATPPPVSTEPPEEPSKASTTPAPPVPENIPEKPAPKANPVGEPGASDLAMAQKYLRGANGRRNSAAALPWLWAAVKKGNVGAEVALADLYMRGDGVQKNCTQARVLLMAASKKGNAAATQKLQEVDRRGCP